VIPKTLQAWYYFRIIIVFVFIWIPGMILITCGAAYDGEKDIGRYMSVGYLFASIQPVLSLIALMTKADVRKCIVDVVTLSFIFQRN